MSVHSLVMRVAPGLRSSLFLLCRLIQLLQLVMLCQTCLWAPGPPHFPRAVMNSLLAVQSQNLFPAASLNVV